jgi:hypothetical protein
MRLAVAGKLPAPSRPANLGHVRRTDYGNTWLNLADISDSD